MPRAADDEASERVGVSPVFGLVQTGVALGLSCLLRPPRPGFAGRGGRRLLLGYDLQLNQALFSDDREIQRTGGLTPPGSPRKPHDLPRKV